MVRASIGRDPETATFRGLGLSLMLALVMITWMLLWPGAVSGSSSRNAALITREPFLQTSTSTSIIVRWRTNVLTTSRVRYGNVLGVYGSSAIDTTLTTEHEIVVDGLSPGSLYYYVVGTADTDLTGGGPTYYFRTHPSPGAEVPVRVWILGDSGTADSNAVAVRDAYSLYPGADSTDVWLTLGDNAYLDGFDIEYRLALFDMYPAFLRNTTLWPAQGNHDRPHAPNPDYFSIFSLPMAGEAGGIPSGSEAYYSFDYANVHFICLGTYLTDMNPGGPMLTWLVADLAATGQEWTIAYWHHPPYSRGSHDSDIDWAMKKIRENALSILESRGVDLVLGGHSHSYERSFLLNGHYDLSSTLADSMKIDPGNGAIDGDGAYLKLPGAKGTVYAVCGSSGWTGGGPLDHPVMVTSLNVLGSMVLDIFGDELTGRFIDDLGVVRDSFTISKSLVTDVSGPASVTLTTSDPLLCFPNPFSTSTKINFSALPSSPVQLTVYDIRGRIVRHLLNGVPGRASHSIIWDGMNEERRPVTSGVYFIVVREPGRERSIRLNVLH